MNQINTLTSFITALTLVCIPCAAQAADKTPKRLAKPNANKLGDTATHEVGHLKPATQSTQPSEANPVAQPKSPEGGPSNDVTPTNPKSEKALGNDGKSRNGGNKLFDDEVMGTNI